jgi:hypothetical protein
LIRFLIPLVGVVLNLWSLMGMTAKLRGSMLVNILLD